MRILFSSRTAYQRSERELRFKTTPDVCFPIVETAFDIKNKKKMMKSKPLSWLGHHQVILRAHPRLNASLRKITNWDDRKIINFTFRNNWKFQVQENCKFKMIERLWHVSGGIREAEAIKFWWVSEHRWLFGKLLDLSWMMIERLSI